MNMEYWWNKNDKGKPALSEENLSHCYFIHHKSLYSPQISHGRAWNCTWASALTDHGY